MIYKIQFLGVQGPNHLGGGAWSELEKKWFGASLKKKIIRCLLNYFDQGLSEKKIVLEKSDLALPR